jgi:hypothetical protein
VQAAARKLKVFTLNSEKTAAAAVESVSFLLLNNSLIFPFLSNTHTSLTHSRSPTPDLMKLKLSCGWLASKEMSMMMMTMMQMMMKRELIELF